MKKFLSLLIFFNILFIYSPAVINDRHSILVNADKFYSSAYDQPPVMNANVVRGYGQPPVMNANVVRGYGQPPVMNANVVRGYGQPPVMNANVVPGYGQPPVMNGVQSDILTNVKGVRACLITSTGQLENVPIELRSYNCYRGEAFDIRNVALGIRSSDNQNFYVLSLDGKINAKIGDVIKKDGYEYSVAEKDGYLVLGLCLSNPKIKNEFVTENSQKQAVVPSLFNPERLGNLYIPIGLGVSFCAATSFFTAYVCGWVMHNKQIHIDAMNPIFRLFCGLSNVSFGLFVGIVLYELFFYTPLEPIFNNEPIEETYLVNGAIISRNQEVHPFKKRKRNNYLLISSCLVCLVSLGFTLSFFIGWGLHKNFIENYVFGFIAGCSLLFSGIFVGSIFKDNLHIRLGS